MVRVYTKDVGEVRDVFRRECEVVETFEDRTEKWVKKDMGRLWI